MTIKDETLGKAQAEGWAHAVTRQIARNLCEGKAPRTQAEAFEQATLRRHCEQVAAREGVSLATVVLDYASDRR